MQSQLKIGSHTQASRLNWLPQRSVLQRRQLQVNATSGAAPPSPPVKELPKDTVTRQHRRTVYDFALWAKHRDVNRYLYNLKTIPTSRIIRTLSQPMGVVLAWAALFGFYETCIESGVLPAYLPRLTLMSAEPQGLTSFALSLLLVFRTNSSYGRFDEARKIWGGILNRARNIANQAVTFIPPEDAAGREAVGKWTVGFCRALQAHLQEDADLRAELKKAQPRWSQEEIDILCSAQHRPIKAISMLSELTRQLSITEFQALQMQENVTFFYDALGGCERLLRTPIPVSYTRHTARFLTIWLALLPLGLWERYHWSMLPVIALIGLLLLGIDEIGITIEEPFGILPLDAICTRAQTDVVSLIKEDPEVSRYVAEVREGRIKAPAEPPPAPAAPAAAAAAPAAAPTPVVPTAVIPPPAVGGGIRSGSPAPGVMKTVTSMFSNVRAGIGAVAPGAPPQPPRAPSPATRSPSPRTTSPGKPSPFPRASAGTGMLPPRPVTPVAASVVPPAAPPVTAPGLNGSSKAAAAPPPPAKPAVSGPGFTMGFGGLSEAAAKLSKFAETVTSGSEPLTAAAAAEAKPEVEAAAAVKIEEAEAEPDASTASVEVTSSSSSAAPVQQEDDDDSSAGSSSRSGSARGAVLRMPANWREELAALRAEREREEAEEAAAAAQEERDAGRRQRMEAAVSALEEEPVATSSFGDRSDADDEAVRRFGSLAGRSRSAATAANGNGNGNGENGNGHSSENGNGNGNGNGERKGEAVRARPRTRPDWRDQL